MLSGTVRGGAPVPALMVVVFYPGNAVGCSEGANGAAEVNPEMGDRKSTLTKVVSSLGAGFEPSTAKADGPGNP